MALCTSSSHALSQTRATKESVANLRSAIKNSAGIIATGTLEMGKEISVLQPVCATLEKMKESWDEIQRNEERLAELHELCEVITSFVVVKCDGGRENVDITPLKECVDDLEALVADYSRRGLCSKLCNRDSEVIERLSNRIEDLVPIMDLAATVAVSQQVTAMGSSVNQLIRQLELNWARNECLLVSRVALRQHAAHAEFQTMLSAHPVFENPQTCVFSESRILCPYPRVLGCFENQDFGIPPPKRCSAGNSRH